MLVTCYNPALQDSCLPCAGLRWLALACVRAKPIGRVNPFGKVVFGKVVPFGIWYLVFGKVVFCQPEIF